MLPLSLRRVVKAVHYLARTMRFLLKRQFILVSLKATVKLDTGQTLDAIRERRVPREIIAAIIYHENSMTASMSGY